MTDDTTFDVTFDLSEGDYYGFDGDATVTVAGANYTTAGSTGALEELSIGATTAPVPTDKYYLHSNVRTAWSPISPVSSASDNASGPRSFSKR